ncbi:MULTISPECIES: complex I subunit 4 family protein [unclassified Candidatus Frackibacter]|uniref:complex I subunit 4 family protein n=1 Tax=unclassified Candidatus Frackibacter TaxID=2648818 RepID=UPI000888DDF4|nr:MULTISPECIES: NADH-quinone oxidoreductase subunit M [unclassified Candidatus Frackibacter]SDC80685.1 NADH dehydrogenase subunit M [Candidatus Frackibacter sp. WG11]SEM93144.1 NADH dehydrogenase subunit M [Candidatus Frackibacter sp. WG12]SFM02732.1 NADH dehydrogenase subunit M [Candidatus Frackibacter sp. WG13]
MLSTLVFVPLIGAIITMFLPKEEDRIIKIFALLVSLIPIVLVGMMWLDFDMAAAGMQFVEKAEWIPSLGVTYHLGVDGISFPLLVISALITTMAIITSWNIDHRVKDFFAFVLLLETGLLGLFVALDYVLFYIFWEIVLVPMYFLIGIWGGPRRRYASIKFFIYTLLGSVVMLVGILALYFGSGLQTFDILTIAQQANLSPTFQWWLFLAFFLGFAVKVPVFPFHTWLPDAHVEAPTGGSMLLAGVLLKMGAYGFYRISYTTFPDAAQSFALFMGVLGVVNIIYGALAAMAQEDVKKMAAYSSISHMGFVLVGLAAMTPMSMNGGLYVLFSHGLISPLMFFFVGSVFYDRTHTRMMGELGGLYTKIPLAAGLLAFTAFANLGLPGLSGFIGEFFTFAGTWTELPNLVMIAVVGLVFTAAYHLRMMQKVLMGDAPAKYDGLPDISARELWVAIPLMLLIIWAGIYPNTLLSFFNPSVESILAVLGVM